MPPIEIRPFHPGDLEQVERLVSAHADAMLPGLRVPPEALAAELEGGLTLVARQRGRITAAAHLRPGDGGDPAIRWFLVWPDEASWPDASAAGDELLAAGIAELEGRSGGHVRVDGALPAPVVQGVPEQWPHVRAALRRAGFAPAGDPEFVFAADVAWVPNPRRPPVRRLRAQREAGTGEARFTATLGGRLAGTLETAILDVSRGEPDGGRWAAVRRLEVEDAFRRRGVATWLVGRAADWLAAAGASRLLAHAGPEEGACAAFLAASPFFRELTRARRGWVRDAL